MFHFSDMPCPQLIKSGHLTNANEISIMLTIAEVYGTSLFISVMLN